MPFILKVLLYCSYFSVLLPMYFLFKERFYTANKILKALSLLLLMAALSDLIGYILIKTQGESNIFLNNAYNIIQFCLLSYIYALFFKNKTIIYVGLILYVVFVSLNTLFVGSFSAFQSWPRIVGNILLFSYSITVITEMYNTPPKDEQMAILFLWINMAVLFYFGMNLYLFGTFDYILKNESADIARISWSFHNVSNIVKNLFFAVGIYYAGRKQMKLT